MLLDELLKLIDDKKEKMIEIRRYLHQYPELSFEEKKTSEYIADFYRDKDVELITNIGGYGIKVIIDTKKPGKTIGLRADMDALPIKEDTGLEFSSKNDGVMHACGHDAHTAYMMILAESLIEMKDKLRGKIAIIHQVAEEVPPGGASFMIKDGVLDGIDNLFGIHVMSQMETGKVYYHKGETQQARAKFTIKIQGRGGHGSSPHEANDSIVAASYLTTALQTIVSRRLSPFEQGVITIGSFAGEGTFNIIKDSVELVGDVRCMSNNAKKVIEHHVRQVSKGICEAFECGLEIDYANDYPVLYNDPDMTQLVVDAVSEAKDKIGLKGIEDSGPQAPSEDFAYYTEIIPCSFFYVGANPEGEAYPHHHPKFMINEDSMTYAAKSVAAVTIKYLMD